MPGRACRIRRSPSVDVDGHFALQGPVEMVDDGSEDRFDRSSFHETLDAGWTGPLARRAGELADNVARVHSPQLLGVAAPVEHLIAT